MIFIALLLNLAYLCTTTDALVDMNVEAAWRYVEYEFDSVREEADALQSGAYYFRKNLPVDVEVTPDKIFVTVLRQAEGVPASLTTMTNRTGFGGGRLLRPYPNWSWTNMSNCDSIINVHRLAQDGCNRLWVVDGGVVENVKICQPKLLIFNLTTDELIDKVIIPSSLAYNKEGKGEIDNVIVDTEPGSCDIYHVFMADSEGYAMVIYDGVNFKRIESSYFDPDPNATDFSVRGVDTNLVEGLLGMALTHEPYMEQRVVYFRPLSSYGMYYAEESDLISIFEDQSSIRYGTEPTNLMSQALPMAFTTDGILFFSQTHEMSISCWNKQKPFVDDNIVTVSKNKKTLQWVSGLKIYENDDDRMLYVFTDRGMNFFSNKMNYTRTNFRILSANIDELIAGTNCES